MKQPPGDGANLVEEGKSGIGLTIVYRPGVNEQTKMAVNFFG